MEQLIKTELITLTDVFLSQDSWLSQFRSFHVLGCFFYYLYKWLKNVLP